MSIELRHHKILLSLPADPTAGGISSASRRSSETRSLLCMLRRNNGGKGAGENVSDMREALASTAFASLEWAEERERAVDRVAASGRAPRLGLDLWKARYLLESKAYQDARKGLVHAFRERYVHETPSIAEKCTEEALSEFLGPACSTCNGARELVIGDLRVECEPCHGSGLKVYSDWERASRMQLSLQWVRKLAPKLAWLAGELGSLDRAVNSVIADQLEKG